MKLKLLVAAIGIAASGFVLADSYQAEVNATAIRFDTDGISSKYESYGLGGSYYFNAVKTDNLPLAEAAYLGKNSNVFAGYSYTEGTAYTPKTNSYGAGVEVYIPENFLYIKAGVARNSYEGDKDSDWFTTVGITPIDGLLITTSYQHDAGYDANIQAKYVTDIGNGQFINVEASLADTDYAGTYKSIGGDFFIDRTFSVGAVIGDDDRGSSYTVRTRKFFSEQFSGELSYSDNDFGNAVSLGASVRF